MWNELTILSTIQEAFFAVFCAFVPGRYFRSKHQTGLSPINLAKKCPVERRPQSQLLCCCWVSQKGEREEQKILDITTL